MCHIMLRNYKDGLYKPRLTFYLICMMFSPLSSQETLLDHLWPQTHLGSLQ